ncbi:MAG TPA: proteasome subunit beta [Candidatus Diapherotrites archaeon]|nr:proteasome subunit beta [Candidatus Diapherotrites archaeon]
MNEEIKRGTTTVGIVAKDGIVLAADSLSTIGHMRANEASTKIYKINDHVALTIAGGVGDALILVRFLQNQANLYELEHKRSMSPKSCVTLLSNVLNSSRMVPFYTQFILGGYYNNSFFLYNLDMVGGITEETKFTFTGSGSELVASILDKSYKPTILVKEAIDLAKEAISFAKKRDIFSGGDGIKVVVIDKNSVQELPLQKFDK